MNKFTNEEFKEHYTPHAQQIKTSLYKNINQDFSKEQIEILIGSMLGDGSLAKVNNSNRNSSFEETHSISQYDYLKWKEEKLSPFSKPITTRFRKAPQIVNGKIIHNDSKMLEGCRFRTINHSYLTQLERKWYLRDDNGNYVFKKVGKQLHRIKIVPEDLQLTPLTIAVWFFDDGSNNPSQRHASFSTLCFTYEECLILSEKLFNFGIKCGVCKSGNNFSIHTRVCSYLDLINLVAEYLPCEQMEYKVDLSNYKEPNYKSQSTISEDQAKQVIELAKQGISSIKISNILNITRATIDGIRFGKTWKELNGGRLAAKKEKNKHGITGGVICRVKNNKEYFETYMHVNANKIYLGGFNRIKDAVSIRKEAEQMYENGVLDIVPYLELKEKWKRLKT